MQLIARKELAEKLSISLRFLDILTKDRKIPHFKIGKSVRYDLDDVQPAIEKAFLRKQKKKAIEK